MIFWMFDLRFDCVNKEGFFDDDFYLFSEVRLIFIFFEVGISGIFELFFFVSYWLGVFVLDLVCDNFLIEFGFCDCNKIKFLLVLYI